MPDGSKQLNASQTPARRLSQNIEMPIHAFNKTIFLRSAIQLWFISQGLRHPGEYLPYKGLIRDGSCGTSIFVRVTSALDRARSARQPNRSSDAIR